MRVEAVAYHLGHGVQDMSIELVDEMSFLEYRDEDVRRDHAVTWGFPACQGFGTGKFTSQRADHGLQGDVDVAFLQGFVQVFAYIVLHLGAQAELLGIDGKMARSVFLDGIAGKLGFVVKNTGEFSHVTGPVKETDAGLEGDVRVADEGLHALAGLGDALLDIHGIGEDGEVVCTQMREQLMREGLQKDVLDVLQAQIPLAESMRRIVEMEIRDIENTEQERIRR